jgi:hypothetical protein
MRVVPIWVGIMLVGSSAAAADIGFLETFALAPDRAVALKQLIPGTEDYYYYHSLHLMQTERFDEVETLTRPWRERFGQTQRLTEIETRHMLLAYDRNPARTLAYLRKQIGLRFDHQREVAGAAPNLPTALDPKLISRDALRADSLQRWGDLQNFEDAGLEQLAGVDLPWEKRRNLLQRLQRPDVPNLPKLVIDDLSAPHPQDFGSLPIHAKLTLTQLEELLKLLPSLLTQPRFVQTWVAKLQPGADDDLRRDRAVTRAYLERLEAFVGRLPPAFNSLKAHVLYQRLMFDRAEGVYDKARFLAYLKLPRRQPYMPRPLLESAEAARFPADLAADFGGVTLLPPVGSDEPLVRDHLKHFLKDAASPAEFAPLIDGTYLRHLFAEVKVENGLGDPEVWASQLPPELFKALRERVDIDFAPTNKADFAAGEPVRLDLFVKNVPNLVVKVFEVNTPNFYKTHQKEIDTDVNLDGLVPTEEKAHPSAESPLRRVARRFEFPALTKPGVYVLDFIGAGKSSRALVRVGRLRPLVRTGPAGQIVTVIDDANRPVPDAGLWLAGREYRADKAGAITVPFGTAPGRKPIALTRGDFASLDYLQHQAEAYSLAAGIHVDRESLLTQRVAPILVRPGLTLNGQPASVKLLEQVRLRITTTDHAGISTSVEVADFKLFEDRESVHEVRVPPRLANISITLTAKVKALSTQQTLDLSASRTFALNGIDVTDKIEDLHLAKFGPDWVVELLGRTGEPKPDRPVRLSLKHREFREPVAVTLKTDGRGRVTLGPLADIAAVTATGPENTSHTWPLTPDRHTYRQIVHAKAGDTINLPYFGAASREDVALFAVRGETIRADRFDALAVANGMLELRGLAAGDYDLYLKRTGERVRIRVVAGPVEAGYVLGGVRHLELPKLKPVQVEAVTPTADGLSVKLRHSSPFTRVHVFATRYRPAFSAFGDLSAVRAAELAGVAPGHAPSVYLTGRNIGDEMRYVLDRRGQKAYPGTMLDRPQLLLNPWAVRTTETGEQLTQKGDDFGARGMNAPAAPLPAPAAPPGESRDGFAVQSNLARIDLSPDLDFLADTSAVLVNLVPDQDGVVKLTRAEVGPHALIHVVAVDPLNTTARTVSLPEQPARFADRRLRAGLDPAGHFAQQKQVSVLAPGKPFTLADAAAGRFEAYDSLARMYALYATLSKDPKLAEFAFVPTWPTLKAEEKRALYSKYACHELNFFLAKRDPEFFKAAVRPFLANKKDKTFLDRWLLDEDVGYAVAPWEYGRLNTVERVLLAQRVSGEPAKTARHLGDLLRLLPPDTNRGAVLFDTAVQGGELAADNRLGELREKQYAAEFDRLPAPPAAAAPGGGGGFAAPRGAAGPGVQKFRREGRSGGDKKMEGAEELAKPVDGKDKAGEAEMLFLDDAQAGRKVVRQLYRQVEQTKEWAENNYYHLLIGQQVADLIPPGPFWLDYAKHDGKTPFLSKHLADAGRNFPEMMFALSVLDLPFAAGKAEVKFDGGAMTYTPAGPAVAFHEEVLPAAVDGRTPVLVSQNFYRHGDRYRDENGERLDKFVSGEFVVQTVYGCQVVVSNPTSSRQKLSLLVQVPVGAIPVAGGQFTKSFPLDLEPYRTVAFDVLFYFPKAGRFAQFPAHVSKGDRTVAHAAPATFDVVEKPSKPDTTSWAAVSQDGSTDDVLAFLNRENVHALDLDRIAWRMKDRAAFEAVVKLLADRHSHNQTLWSYSLLHADVPAARQYLAHADQIVTDAGGPIRSPLLVVDPVARHSYEHLEYKPLVNARAHSLGHTRQIVNDRFHGQYHNYLKQVSYHRSLDDADRLAAAYYLLLQDRTAEAIDMFGKVNPDRVPTRVQYDYLAAYLEMVGDQPDRARPIADTYASYPVDRWRNAFAEVRHQLDEATGRAPNVADADDRTQRQGQLAATEPGFEFAVEGKAVQLAWQNLDAVRVNYYPMDVELLFSRNPFARQSGGQFAAVRPAASREVKLPSGTGRQAIPIPDEFARRNVLVEVTAAGQSRTQPYYATAMDVNVTEAYGQVRVLDAAGGKPLPKVYVKVYSRGADGGVKFHKDGYTDLRGRFDYATVSTPERVPAERFAVLVLSGDRGATIREAAPPLR